MNYILHFIIFFFEATSLSDPYPPLRRSLTELCLFFLVLFWYSHTSQNEQCVIHLSNHRPTFFPWLKQSKIWIHLHTFWHFTAIHSLNMSVLLWTFQYQEILYLSGYQFIYDSIVRILHLTSQVQRFYVDIPIKFCKQIGISMCIPEFIFPTRRLL